MPSTVILLSFDPPTRSVLVSSLVAWPHNWGSFGSLGDAPLPKLSSKTPARSSHEVVVHAAPDSNMPGLAALVAENRSALTSAASTARRLSLSTAADVVSWVVAVGVRSKTLGTAVLIGEGRWSSSLGARGRLFLEGLKLRR
jgi:hypothetical protein